MSATAKRRLKAPFPAFGGKSAVANMVWQRFGPVANYIEPFARSCAVLLARPDDHGGPRIETVNDLECNIANFWRAVKSDPAAVARYADHPVNEADLHARHRFLVGIDPPKPVVPESFASDPATKAAYLAGWRGQRSGRATNKHTIARWRERVRSDPDYFDARIAGWWVWGACCWIGSGWCDDGNEEKPQPRRPAIGQDGHGLTATGPHSRKPAPCARVCGNGVVSKGDVREGRPQLADKFTAGRGVHAHAGTCDQIQCWLLAWMQRLSDRFRRVRVCCGDWKRVCDSPSVTTRLGITGVFLDPPYSKESGRDMNIYNHGSGTVAHDVRKWCLKHGQNHMMRIALCGYTGEHEALEAAGWECVPWKTQGGYGNLKGQRNDNAKRERIWFSPHCLRAAPSLFDII